MVAVEVSPDFGEARRRLRCIEDCVDPSLYPGPEPDPELDPRCPAAALVAASLRARMNWESTVAPRVERFREQFPGVASIEDLSTLISPMTDGEVAGQVLGISYNSLANRRPAILRDLVDAFVSYRREHVADLDEAQGLVHWAQNSPDHPHNWISRVHGVGADTISWLRDYVGSAPVSEDDRRLFERGLSALGLSAEDVDAFCTASRLTPKQLRILLRVGLEQAQESGSLDAAEAPLEVDWAKAIGYAASGTAVSYESGLFRPRTESDLRAFIYAYLTRLLSDADDALEGYHWQRDHSSLHADWSTGAFPRALRGETVDLIAGGRDLAVEAQFQPQCPGGAAGELERLAAKARRDIDRLQALKEAGFESCHFVMLDETGYHERHLQRHGKRQFLWRPLRRRDGQTAALLHLVL